MKRTTHLVIILLFSCLFTQAQEEYEYTPFPDSNAIWSEFYVPPYGSDKDPSYHAIAIFNEDTVIEGITYQKLFRLYDTVLNREKTEFIGGIREDSSKRIYFKGEPLKWLLPSDNVLNENSEILLYNFSIKEGDTLRDYNFALHDDFLVVKKIDTILINGEPRKKYHFQYSWQKWIEGVGNIRGLLFVTGDIPNNGILNTLVCFKHFGYQLYFNDDFSSCFPGPLANSTGKLRPVTIEVYPNPAEDNIFFNKLESYDKLVIYNLHGQLLEDQNIFRRNKFSLSTSNYAPGLYFYKLTGKPGLSKTGKFIVK